MLDKVTYLDWPIFVPIQIYSLQLAYIFLIISNYYCSGSCLTVIKYSLSVNVFSYCIKS